MCRVVTGDHPRSLHAPAQARHLVARTLSSWGLSEPPLSEVREVAELLTSELVTNAVRHAHSPARVVVALAGETLEVGVSDGEHRARLRPIPVPATSVEDDLAWLRGGGRGLQLVDALADEWGVASLATGKQVWFRLEVPGWLHAAHCVCQGDDVDAVRLASGRQVVAMPVA
ncbi:MAG: ATP-binding protein [Motilibacteraceae bacterium]